MPIDLTPIVKPLNDVTEPLTTSLSDAWSAVLGDRIAAWRLRNAAKLQVTVNAELNRLGLSLNDAKIPERYAFAWFDEATKQDEPEIQELFARLLAKASTGDENACDRRNLDILTRMTPTDARVMAWMFERHKLAGPSPGVGEIALVRSLNDEVGDGGVQSFEHLLLLGILEKSYSIDGGRSRISPDRGLSYQGRISAHAPQPPTISCYISGTILGIALYRACASHNPDAGKTAS